MFIRLLFLYLPTSVLVNWTALTFAKQTHHLSWKRLLLFGALQGLFTMFFRDVLQLIGWHTLLLNFSYVMLTFLIFKLRLHVVILLRALILLTIAFGENTITRLYINFWNLQYREVLANPGLHVLVGWLSHLPILILAIFLCCRSLSLGPKGASENEAGIDE